MASTVAGSSAPAPASATWDIASAQSTVSATPGSFERSSRRSRWTNATTRRRSCSPSPGTLRRTISTSVASDG